MRFARAAFAVLMSCSVLAACGGDDSGDGGSDTAAKGQCSYPAGQSAAKQVDAPPAEPESAESMTVTTNRGDFTIALDAENAPCTVNSFVSLAGQQYFDDTICHRVVADFVLQCGDPSGTGTGGPGYSFDDELSGDETYPAGTVAMANAGADTNGSQFFIVLQESPQLTPDYTVFGTVDDAGLALARDIAAEGNGANGVEPKNEVRIESVTTE